MPTITTERLKEIQEIRHIMNRIRMLSKGKDPVEFVQDLIRESDELKLKLGIK